MTGRTSVLLFCLLVGARADTLILKDGSKVSGRWWSIDANEVHFLVNNQLAHYRRADVFGVTFGDASLPPPPPAANATPAPLTAAAGAPVAPPAPPAAAQPAESAPRPGRAPTPPGSSEGPRPPQTPTPSQPNGVAPPAPGRTVSRPNEIGMVYYYNGKDLTPLEKSQAVERKSGSRGYWEMAGAQASVRVEEATEMAFIVLLPKGVDPARYSLFPLASANGNRQTKAQETQRGALMTWPFKIEVNNESGYMTYAFRVRDLPTGEYSFSPSNSNDAYCFGVDEEK